MIRRAVPADAPAVAAIWNRVVRGSTAILASVERSEDEVAGLMADAFWVWDEGGRTLGFARHFAFRPSDGYRHTAEHTVILAPEAQGKGIGRALMGAVIDDARAAGKRVLLAVVTAENAAGLAFHRALGFRDCARLPEVGRKFGRWHDVVVLSLALADG